MPLLWSLLSFSPSQSKKDPGGGQDVLDGFKHDAEWSSLIGRDEDHDAKAKRHRLGRMLGLSPDMNDRLTEDIKTASKEWRVLKLTRGSDGGVLAASSRELGASCNGRNTRQVRRGSFPHLGIQGLSRAQLVRLLKYSAASDDVIRCVGKWSSPATQGLQPAQAPRPNSVAGQGASQSRELGAVAAAPGQPKCRRRRRWSVQDCGGPPRFARSGRGGGGKDGAEGALPPPSMLHHLRTFFDPQYRLLHLRNRIRDSFRHLWDGSSTLEVSTEWRKKLPSRSLPSSPALPLITPHGLTTSFLALIA